MLTVWLCTFAAFGRLHFRLPPTVCRLAVSHLEHRLDRGPVGAGTEPLRTRASAEHGIDRVNQDGLAGAGLTGEDIETRSELQLDLLEEGKVADAKLRQHGGQVPKR